MAASIDSNIDNSVSYLPSALKQQQYPSNPRNHHGNQSRNPGSSQSTTQVYRMQSPTAAALNLSQPQMMMIDPSYSRGGAGGGLESNYKNLVCQSVQSNSNLRSLDFNQVSNGPTPPGQMGILYKTGRQESTSNIRQVVPIASTANGGGTTQAPAFMSQNERNCKTTSPTHHFSSHLQQESRIRKISREMMQKNKERLADLLVILGLKYNELVENRRFSPQIVDSYPSLQLKEVAKEHNYVENLIWICFPEGYSVQSYEKRKEGELCQMKIFHFIITNQDGLKKYITSILFKELFLSEKRGSFIVPKSICVVSSKPVFSLQKQLLTLIFQKVILPYNSASIQAQTQHPANYIWYLNELTEETIKKNPDSYLMSRIEFYITMFFNHLYYSEDVENDIEIEEIRERSTPHHAGGDRRRSKKRIIESFFRYRNTKNYGFILENYSFELLLQSLKPEKIIFLVTCLLLERKIILIKDNFGDIALIMESLVSLLNPLKWNFVFITYLTPKLVECLEAPFPYIIGASRKFWENQCMMQEFPDDIIIFDIDKQEKLNTIREELPPLPQPQATILERGLREVLDIKESYIEWHQQISPNQSNSKEKIDEYYWAYAQLHVKQNFFNFFLLTINNYIGYFKDLDEEGDLSPAKKDKKFYDKLSSTDVFDFDSYLAQFTGPNREFMERLIHTQSFNNFIEDTYKNISPQTPIGFFKTNFEVVLAHSFKRLKREQKNLIDLTLFNLHNPVKFNIGHMFKQYKRQLLSQHGAKLRQLLKEEGDLNTQADHSNDEQLELAQRQDLLEKLLLLEVEGNTKKQLSVLNGISQEIVTSMPGIQYEHISTYEMMKSQRSDQSQDRRAHNKTMLQGNISVGLSGSGFDFQKVVKNSHGAVGDEQSDTKSRNHHNSSTNYIIQQRSGDNALIRSMGGYQQREGAIYKNYLSMADNKNLALLQQEDEQLGLSMQLGKGGPEAELEKKLTQQSPTAQGALLSKHDHAVRAYNELKSRVNSDSQSAKGLGQFQSAMNKTVIVNSNQHLQRAPTASNAATKSKTTRLEVNGQQPSQTPGPQGPLFMNQSYQLQKGMLTAIGTLKGIDKQRCTSSPRPMQTKNNASGGQNETSKSQQQSVLKEALNRKIMYERTKHGLQLKSDDRGVNHSQYNQNISLNTSNLMNKSNLQLNQSSGGLFSPTTGQTTSKNHQGGGDQSGAQQSSFRHVPKMNIDLMNPKKQKISRNEERKIAKQRGYLGFEQHDSFYQFYSPKEEFSKLSKMNIIKSKMGDAIGADSRTRMQQLAAMVSDSRDNISFSNYINAQQQQQQQQQQTQIPTQQQQKIQLQQNYNSNGSDEDQLSKMLKEQQQQTKNKIVFQKRSPTTTDFLVVSNDPLTTTINFQSNFIQQKPQYSNQSPSITNTELSSSIKKSKVHPADSIDEDFCIINTHSPLLDSNKKKSSAQHHQQIASKYSPVVTKASMTLKGMHSPPQDYARKSRESQGASAKGTKTKSQDIDFIAKLSGSKGPALMDFDFNDGHPVLSLEKDECLTETRNQQLGEPSILQSIKVDKTKKHPKLRGSESPKTQNQLTGSSNLSFKQFMNTVGEQQNTVTGGTTKVGQLQSLSGQVASKRGGAKQQIQTTNKSPKNFQLQQQQQQQTVSKFSMNAKGSEQQKVLNEASMMKTFDHTNRNDLSKATMSNVIQRKRSSPAMAAANVPSDKQTHQDQQMRNPHKSNNSSSKQSNDQQQPASAGTDKKHPHFKQRPATHAHQKGQKSQQSQQTKSYQQQQIAQQTHSSGSNSHYPTIQIDLQKKEKLTHLPPSRLGLDQEVVAPSLRVSPIPNLNQILLQDSTVSLPQQDKSEHDFSEQHNKRPSAADGGPHRQSNSMIQQVQFSSNFNSRQSATDDKASSVNTFHNQHSSSSNLNLNLDSDPCPAAMFQSMTTNERNSKKFQRHNLEKQSSVVGQLKRPHSKSTKHQYNSGVVAGQAACKAKYSTALNNGKNPSLSQRSSSTLKSQQKLTEARSRGSNLSLMSLQRPSQLSLLADFNRQEKEIELLNSLNSASGGPAFMMASSSLRQSDILAQTPRDLGLNAAASITAALKGSPKLMDQAISNINAQLLLQGSNPQSSNFSLQEGSKLSLPQQPSIMTSQDVQSMQSFLNALKTQLPQTTTAQAMNSVNTVKIDLDRSKKHILSPKGLGGSGSKAQNLGLGLSKQGSKPILHQVDLRASSIDDGLAHHTPNLHQAASSTKRMLAGQIATSGTKKHVKSPQPSSNVLSSNSYLKSLTSQEFQLKEKTKKKYMQAYNTMHNTNTSGIAASGTGGEPSMCSNDPLISLQKETKLGSGSKAHQGTLSKLASNVGGAMSSSRKSLKLETFQELGNGKSKHPYPQYNTQLQQQYNSQKSHETTGLMSRKSSQKKGQAGILGGGPSVRPKPSVSGQHQMLQLKDYGQDDEDFEDAKKERHTITSSQSNSQKQLMKLRQEQLINSANETLQKIEVNLKQAKSTNILEETLTSKSNSIGSYQTSPKVLNSTTTHMHQQQFKAFKNHAGNQINSQSTIFKTAVGVSGSAGKEEGSAQSTNQMMPTVRNNELPIKKISFAQQQQKDGAQERESKLLVDYKTLLKGASHEPGLFQDASGKQAEQMTFETLMGEIVVIDFPKQIEDKEKMTKQIVQEFQDRTSNLIMDIDKIMEEKPQERSLRQGWCPSNDSGCYSGITSQKHSDACIPLSHMARSRSYKSHMQKTNDNQPLIEIQYNSNGKKEPHNSGSQPSLFQVGGQKQKTMSSASIDQNQMRGHNKPARNQHGLPRPSCKHSNSSHFTENSGGGLVSSRHSHAVAGDRLPHELGQIVSRQKLQKQQMRQGGDGGTTKESGTYVKRDLNQEAFCKINCHRGDIDNDPHTPKSNGSLRSIEKNSRRKRQQLQLGLDDLESSSPLQY